jgi:hypothetical protein
MVRLGSVAWRPAILCGSLYGDWVSLFSNIVMNRSGPMIFKHFVLVSIMISNLGVKVYSQHIHRIEIESIKPVQKFQVVCRGIKENSVTQDMTLFSDSLGASTTAKGIQEISIPKFDKDVLFICILVFIENEYRGCIQFMSRKKGVHRSKSLRINWVGVGLEYAIDD